MRINSPINLNPEIFRMYDIRGIVGETLSPAIIYIIAKAIGEQALSQGQNTVIIARDGRLSAIAFSQALKQGLLDSGCKVIDIQAVPTPVLYFATHVLNSQSGVMLTGSHNPGNYNGLKIVIAGQTLSEEKIQELYQRIISKQAALPEILLQSEHYLKNLEAEKNSEKSGNSGNYKIIDIIPAYIDRITQDILLKKKLKIIVDAGSGIAGKLIGKLYRALGCEVKELFCEVDGNFPHHHPDPSVPENLVDLIQAVKQDKADLGLAFDGDGDRLGVVTNDGEIIWPDRQMMLYAKDVLSRCPGEKIIFDVKCTAHLAKFINSIGGIAEMWKTGHSLLKHRMADQKAPLAGEMSGHIFFKERWYGFDDGLYTGARLLEILSKDPRACSEIFKDFPNSLNTPELKLAVNSHQRKKILSELEQAPIFQTATLITLDGIRAEFKNGWGLIRGSNTTPHLTLRFEADDQTALEQIQAYFRQELLNLDHTLELPF